MPRTAQLLEKLGALEDEANRAFDLYKEIFQQNPGTYPRPGKPPVYEGNPFIFGTYFGVFWGMFQGPLVDFS